MSAIDGDAIATFLQEVGRRHQGPATLLLLGGAALGLLGHPRPTVDIDYVGDDRTDDDLQRTIRAVSKDLGFDAEAVPIAEFVPIPDGSAERNVPVGRYGSVEVVVVDPYVIALSKVERGFATDIEDVVFLVQRDFITLVSLEDVTRSALRQAHAYGMDPEATLGHLEAVRRRVEGP